jgi:PTH1 family peptidyl-tRNA hydrolase
MTDTWLIVGLGNPGAEYKGNRHNVGQMVLDELAGRMGGKFKTHKARAQVLEGRLGIGGPRVVLSKPMSYMNVSGGPVAGLANFYGIDPDHVIAVHDEIDIPFNTVKLKCGGGEGGHNGLRDMSKALATKDYLRVRVGVGRPPGRMDTADYVLRDFGTAERKDLPFLLDEAADAVEMLVRDGLTAAQQKFHPARSDVQQ